MSRFSRFCVNLAVASLVILGFHRSSFAQNLIQNPGFEFTPDFANWTIGGAPTAPIVGVTFPHIGSKYAYMGEANDNDEFIWQAVDLSGATSATLSFWYNINTEESQIFPFDKMTVTVRNTSNQILGTLIELSNTTNQVPGSYAQYNVSGNLNNFTGQTVRIYFRTTTDASLGTFFRVDDVVVNATVPTRTLSVASSNPGSGVSITVSPSNCPGGTSTPFSCTYSNGTPVNLTAPATASGNTFSQWQRNGSFFSSSTSTQVTMDADYTMAAVYSSPATRTLSVASSNPGSGVSITVSPSNCPGGTSTPFSCTYSNGTPVNLTAPATAGGNTFSQWQRNGAFYSSSPGIQVTMDADYSMTAFYTSPVIRTLNVASTNPNSNVLITVSPSNCPGGTTTPFSCTYSNGTPVNLTAPAAAGGNAFSQWQRNGSFFSPSASTQVTMDADYTMSAVYVVPVVRTLTVNSTAPGNPNNSVFVTVSPTDNDGLASGTTQFSRRYDNGQMVSLTAPPNSGTNVFQKWQRDGVDIPDGAAAQILMDANHTLTAVYVSPPPLIRTLTVLALNSPDPMRVTVTPTDLSGQSDGYTPFPRSFNDGTVVDVRAEYGATHSFVKWMLDGDDASTSLSFSVTMDSDHTITAVYSLARPDFDVVDPGTGHDLVVKWTQPDKTGVTSYRVEWGTTRGAYTTWRDTLETGQAEYRMRIGGLQENTRYYVDVRARNASQDLFSSYSLVARSKTPNLPVVLVHGLTDNASVWSDYSYWLNSDGYSNVWAATLNPCGALNESAFSLNAFNLSLFIRSQISTLKAQTLPEVSASQVNIIAHSMGGLVARRLIAHPDYFAFLGKYVNNLVMLGTPNGGTWYGNLACVPWGDYLSGVFTCAGGANCELGSFYLDQFNKDNSYRGPLPTKFYAVAGNACCGRGTCGGWWCLFRSYDHDGVVSVNSVFTISLNQGYVRSLKHSELPHDLDVLDDIIEPILRSHAPLVVASASTAEVDSIGEQIIHGNVILTDSSEWSEDSVHFAAGQAMRIDLVPYASDAELVLVSPSGGIVDSLTAITDLTNYSFFHDPDLLSISVNEPDTGLWTVRVRTSAWRDTIAPVAVFVEVDDDVSLTFYDYQPTGELRDSVVLRARFADGGVPIVGASVIISSHEQGGMGSWNDQMRDDGSGADSVANDGIYSAVFDQTDSAGWYAFKCQAVGQDSQGGRAQRFAVLQTYITGIERGDMDGDGVYDVRDVVAIVGVAFRGEAAPYPELIADVNCDGITDVTDVVRLIDHVFRGGPQPSCP